MGVTPAQVGVELGKTAPFTQLQQDQWLSWIDQALLLIRNRLGDPTLLDQANVDYVVLMAVVDHARHPGNETQVSVSADDGSVARTYRSGAGRVVIADDLWRLLDPDLDDTGAFGITPTFVSDLPTVP